MHFLRENFSVFALSTKFMLGINLDILYHNLAMNPKGEES